MLKILKEIVTSFIKRNKLGRSRSVINKKLFDLVKFIIDRERKVHCKNDYTVTFYRLALLKKLKGF